ncbi:hypothetical protein FA13DRAFT_1798660 [Coprinellus micaceus]|uniref:Uncharacterized protein n=1 Tax=Coprinellus micaceus TaxID=71717 RepID=A0A4Y7RMH9_COPMI|nr:hypothetical protein FA13DRAFT_1806367 [Coprinellus micaceus]TEB22673.1 hypothetical protein FA13DRAFT_1798660 [Coprinellus micaceus]
MARQVYALSLSQLINIINTFTEDHISADDVLAVLDELSVGMSEGTTNTVTTTTTPATDTRANGGAGRRDPPNQLIPRATPNHQSSDTESAPRLSASFGNMRLSPCTGPEGRHGAVSEGGLRTHAARQVHSPHSGSRRKQRRAHDGPQPPPNSSDTNSPLPLPAQAHSSLGLNSPPPLPAHHAATSVGLPRAPPDVVTGGRSSGANRWYCVTNGEQVGAILGWDDTKASTHKYPNGCQHRSIDHEKAIEEFLKFARGKLHEIRPVSGRVVGIPGMQTMDDLAQWVRQANQNN